MPHQCTGCGHTFPDGSKEMLSGCPSCGGKKFQFLPAAAQETEPPDGATSSVGTESTPARGSKAVREEPSTASGDGRPPAVESDLDSDDGSEMSWAGDEPGRGEDSAQAAARSTVVSRDELPDPVDAGDSASVVQDAEPADLDTLRTELNEQFESIKILEPGQYELNLMELFDRDERIIAIEEDGRYVIDVPEEWRDDE